MTDQNTETIGQQIRIAIVAAAELSRSLDTLQRRAHGPFDSGLVETAAADVTAIYIALGEALVRCGHGRIKKYTEQQAT